MTPRLLVLNGPREGLVVDVPRGAARSGASEHRALQRFQLRDPPFELTVARLGGQRRLDRRAVLFNAPGKALISGRRSLEVVPDSQTPVLFDPAANDFGA